MKKRKLYWFVFFRRPMTKCITDEEDDDDVAAADDDYDDGDSDFWLCDRWLGYMDGWIILWFCNKTNIEKKCNDLTFVLISTNNKYWL